jgi:hypothetical protein
MSEKHARCKCGGEIITDSASRTVMHSLPPCEWFIETVNREPPDFTNVVSRKIDVTKPPAKS